MKFRSGKLQSLKDGLQSGRHSDVNEKALQILVNENPRLTIQELANRLKISLYFVNK